MGVPLSEGASQHHFDRRPRLCLPHSSYFSLPPRLTFSADEIVANPLLLNNFTIICLRRVLTVLALARGGQTGGLRPRLPPPRRLGTQRRIALSPSSRRRPFCPSYELTPVAGLRVDDAA